ncbi:MAG: hypothetical protein F6K25_05690 [Okeania sp. SIO2G4]|uniref:hypothetical protein n=1 Tax=unclassified Okeania TaxID=2634635 RepID=UPI0013BB9403|nr:MULTISPECIES: hypothetical protein [unclassified Okeania]NEP04893.1 hypothetical protein [Okeania sp. SIO4D6]NEP40308.1 hypothetical protein [Okeania sp. SIO2H7]NEP75066.1 hypothetical protein [Okeania sp. SIO2G5]NEP92203.1 hypothetical protein [Okeania sp. SIO2F5]NEQ90239.1 hypothetical protein [Okeania sp. SIO2G4]
MSWSLVYANDMSGNTTAGDKNLLIEAVNQGESVRILVDSGEVQIITVAQTLWVKNGIVYAQNTSHVSVAFQGNILKFQDDSYWFMIVVDTQGNRDVIRWDVGAHNPRGHEQDRVAIKWFVG